MIELPHRHDGRFHLGQVVSARSECRAKEVGFTAERLQAWLAINQERGESRGYFDRPAGFIVAGQRVIGEGKLGREQMSPRLVERHAEGDCDLPGRGNWADNLPGSRRRVVRRSGVRSVA